MSADPVDSGRRKFLRTATTMLGGIGAVYVATPFVRSWLPSARAKAAGAPVEVDVSQLAPGAQMTVEWRGKPIWIVRRTADNISQLPGLDSKLRDPASQQPQQPTYAQNTARTYEGKEEYLVLVGLCTHLGCVPTYRPDANGIEPGWQGGFFCPCHGSKFDLSGRVYKGVPAPTNMEVPPYQFIGDSLIVIGEDGVA